MPTKPLHPLQPLIRRQHLTTGLGLAGLALAGLLAALPTMAPMPPQLGASMLPPVVIPLTPPDTRQVQVRATTSGNAPRWHAPVSWPPRCWYGCQDDPTAP